MSEREITMIKSVPRYNIKRNLHGSESLMLIYIVHDYLD